jgi:hypothetical protein
MSQNPMTKEMEEQRYRLSKLLDEKQSRIVSLEKQLDEAYMDCSKLMEEKKEIKRHRKRLIDFVMHFLSFPTNLDSDSDNE